MTEIQFLMFLWSFLCVAPDRIAKAMILQEMRPPLQMVCTIKIQKEIYEPTKLTWKKLCSPFIFHLSILMSTWSDLLTPGLAILPRHCQDPEKGQETQAQVSAVSGLLLLPLNSLPASSEASASTLLRTSQWSCMTFLTKCLILVAGSLKPQLSESWMLNCGFWLSWEVSCLKEGQNPP